MPLDANATLLFYFVYVLVAQAQETRTVTGWVSDEQGGAYGSFLLAQTFAGVSLVTDRFTAPVESFKRNSAQEVYNFVIKEMTEALELAPETTPTFGRVTKRAVRHMLAKLYRTHGYEPFAETDDFKTANSGDTITD